MSKGGAPPDAASDEELRLHVKSELRKRMRAVRGAVPKAARDARAAKACDRLVELDAWKSAKTVALYAAIRAELSPARLIAAAQESGKRVLLPRTNSHGHTMEFHTYREGDVLTIGPFKVPEPAPDTERVDGSEIDLVIVPALAVDERGYRIGYGRGYYDRWLPRASKARTVALAFDFQVVAELPNMPNDVPVHAVVTDARTVVVGA